MTKTIIGTISQVLSALACKFNKRLYLGQIFKHDKDKYQVSSLKKLEDDRIAVELKKV